MALRLHNRRRHEVVADRNADSNRNNPDCYHHPAADHHSRCTHIGKYFAVSSDLAGFGVFTESGSVFFVPLNSSAVDALPAVTEYRVVAAHPAQR